MKSLIENNKLIDGVYAVERSGDPSYYAIRYYELSEAGFNRAWEDTLIRFNSFTLKGKTTIYLIRDGVIISDRKPYMFNYDITKAEEMNFNWETTMAMVPEFPNDDDYETNDELMIAKLEYWRTRFFNLETTTHVMNEVIALGLASEVDEEIVKTMIDKTISDELRKVKIERLANVKSWIMERK